MAVKEVAKRFVDFANETGSPYHTVAACVKLLRSAGFKELDDAKPWTKQVAKGGKYFVTKDGSDVMAFVVGGKFKSDGSESGFTMVGGHTDSPCLRLRPCTKITGSNMQQVGVQLYGGGLWHTWFDRPLGIAGKVIVRDPNSKSLKETLVHIMKPICIIPNLAIHLTNAEERKAFAPSLEGNLTPILCSQHFDDQVSRVDKEAKDASPMPSAANKHHAALLELIASEAGCAVNDIVDMDMCFMDSVPSNLIGVYEEFISSPRIDNVLSTWAAVSALCDTFTDAKVADCADVAVAFALDHEEVGSQSAVGADGHTIPGWVDRIMGALGVDENARHAVLAKSFLLSADCAHGVHPNYAAKHQAEHRPEFHKGVVIKTNCNQRYATTPLTAAIFREVCSQKNVPVQEFLVRNDSPCGSTIGPILSSQLGIRAIDIGAPQWAMHSIRETCATSDASHLLDCCKAFYEIFREVDNSTARL